MAERLIVIGGTAAGLSAASRARKGDPKLEILVFEKSGYASYGSCGLPYFVGGLIDAPEDLLAMSVGDLETKRGISVRLHQEATNIDREKKQVTVRDLTEGTECVYSYDKLVLATGAVPLMPQIPGIRSKGVYPLRNVEDGIALKHAASGRKRAVIIGGGFIGLEIAEELTLSGNTVSVYEQLPTLLPFLDASFSEMVKAELKMHGVKLHTGVGIAEILQEDGRACGVRTSSGEGEAADFVLVSIGVRPETALAQKAGLSLGIKGGIAVDDEMHTADPDIWACGDCVQMKNRITGAPAYVPLGTTANKQGRIAGANAAGGHETFPGVLGSMVTKVFDLYIAATGLSLKQAEEAGYQAVSSVIAKQDRASYYPGGRENHLCLILDQKTGRLLGAQGAGSESVAGRINVFATAITCGMTVGEINELDLVYAPPVAPVYDPILIAASQAMKKVMG